MDLESITAGVTVTSGVLSTALICGIGYLLYEIYGMGKNEKRLGFVPNINHKINNNY